MKFSLEELPEFPRSEDLERAKGKLKSFLALPAKRQQEYLATQDSLINFLFQDNERLKQEAREAGIDELTGLLGRRAARAEIRRELKRLNRFKEPILVVACLVDVKDLKQVNDEQGYPAGSALLRRVARQLRRSVREPDIVARWGGDEFLIFFFPAEPASARKYSERWQELPVKAWFAEEVLRPNPNRRDRGIDRFIGRLISAVEELHKSERRNGA